MKIIVRKLLLPCTKTQTMKWMLYVLLGLFLLPTYELEGQTRRRRSKLKYEIFEGMAVVGLNASQIDGDNFTGYNKTGWYGGIRGIANFSSTLSLNVELLYSQKGSKIPHEGRNNQLRERRDRMIALNYAEVPIILKYRLSEEVVAPYLDIGLTFSRLIDSKIEERTYQAPNSIFYKEIEEEFNGNDVNFTVGLGLSINRRIEVSLRYTYALGRFYTSPHPNDSDLFTPRSKQVRFLRNYHFSLLVAYKFSNF